MRLKNKFILFVVCLLGMVLYVILLSQAFAEEVKENDSVIEKRILNELREDPFIKSTGIKVTVKNGIVTLTGYVENMTEHAAAAADAFQCGAGEVRNLLKIKKGLAVKHQGEYPDNTPEE